jgi:hypothetical protein
MTCRTQVRDEIALAAVGNFDRSKEQETLDKRGDDFGYEQLRTLGRLMVQYEGLGLKGLLLSIQLGITPRPNLSIWSVQSRGRERYRNTNPTVAWNFSKLPKREEMM